MPNVDNKPEKEMFIPQEVRDKISSTQLKNWRENKEEMLAKKRSTSLQNFGSTCNSNAHVSVESREKLHNIEWLKEQHYVNHRSSRNIADELGVSDTAVQKIFKQAGLRMQRFSKSK